MLKRATLLAGYWLFFGAAAHAEGSAQCDRECLRGFITHYLNALIKRDVSSLPVTSNVKFTEDGAQLKLGEGLWKNASALRPYRLDFLDVRTGTAGSHVVVEEKGSPAFVALRLKITDRKIAEIETLVVRDQKEGSIFDIDSLKTPSEAMTLPLPPTKRSSREEIVRVADYYPAGLKAGSFVAVDAPFAANAYRLENGRLMAGPGCTFKEGCQNIKTQPSQPRPTLTSRLLAVDEEQGIAWYRLTWARENNNKLVVWEAFKVYDGQMHAVEAFIQLEPMEAKSGWE
jgi:hypothetical protein